MMDFPPPRRYRPTGLLLVAALICIAAPLSAGDMSPWQVQIGLSTVYDNNALRYSDKYLGKFENREDEGRFHIKSADDLLFHTTLHLERSADLLGDLSSVLTGDLHVWNYTNNTIKNWQTFTLGARQELPERFSVGFAYSHIPDFYVRHYSDDDWEPRVGPVPARFQPFSFTKDEYRMVLQRQFFQNSRLRMTASILRYYYNEHYTEYDSKNVLWAIDASHPILPTLRIGAGYAYTTSDAQATDAPGEIRATADDADGSFKEDSWSATIAWRLPRIAGLATRLTLDGEYSRRCFTTNHLYFLDNQHAGRIDDEYQASLDWSVELGDAWEATIGYAWRMRDAHTGVPENQILLSDEKDYREYQVEFGVTYDLSF
jgi:hypothetical protein